MKKPSNSLSIHVMAKPTGARCNLECKYCYYLPKEELCPLSPAIGMPKEIQREYVRQTIQAHSTSEVNLTWQGGEPTLMGIDFFRQAVRYANQYRKYGMRIHHNLQTNGILLNKEWCKFLSSNRFLVGVSLDGPEDMHNAFRVDKGGQPTFQRVVKSIELLQEYQVAFNILCTIHAANERYPLQVYRFFRDQLGAKFIQFIPVVERNTRHIGDEVSKRSVNSEQYGHFLNAVFDEWIQRDVGKVFIQLFDVTLSNWVGAPPTLCVHAETCGTALILEHNGDLYSCDHFVFPQYKLGNIKITPLSTLAQSPQQQQFGLDKLRTLPQYCLTCSVRFLCHGGCPKDRFCTTPNGETGLNYLCAGYKRFFEHTQNAMRFMAEELRHNRPPANIMHSERLARNKS